MQKIARRQLSSGDTVVAFASRPNRQGVSAPQAKARATRKKQEHKGMSQRSLVFLIQISL